MELNQISSYKIDDQAVDVLFDTSNDITYVANPLALFMPTQEQVKDEDKQLVAGIIAIAELVLGVGILIPIHRLYLGTGDETFKVVALYCVTLAGCGFITLIDGIMLLSDSQGSKYIESPKFIMW
jgi:hypothetical protein